MKTGPSGGKVFVKIAMPIPSYGARERTVL